MCARKLAKDATLSIRGRGKTLNLNFTGLTQELQLQTGDFSGTAGTQRAMREGGLMGSSAKDPRKPQIASVHGVSGLFSALIQGPNARLVENVRKVWRLKPVYAQSRQRDEHGTESIGPAVHIKPDKRLLGQEIGLIMSLLAPYSNPLMSLGAPADSVTDMYENVAVWVWQGCSQAAIEYKTLRVIYAVDDSEEAVQRGDLLARPSIIEAIKKAPRVSLARLGQLVRASEAEAARRGIEISTDTAWKALGFVKPEGDFTSHPLVELPRKESSISPAKEAATALPGAAAADDDQPVNKQAADGSTGHPTRARTHGASACSQVGLLQPIGAGVYHDYGPQYELCCAAE